MSESASGLAGVKAGVFGAIFFAVAIGLFNSVLLEAFKGTVLAALQTYSGCSGAAAPGCFSRLASVDILYLIVLPAAVSGILFGTLYGMYFEYLPGLGYRVRAVAIGMAMLIMLLFFGFAGIIADQEMKIIMYAFDLVAMLGYVLIIARFYRKYTREVEFQSPNPKKLKITVDNKNFTGKTKTLSLHSSHKVSAPSEGGAFHQWLVSGGISVLDAKSLETTMKVDGDGLLKIS